MIKEFEPELLFIELDRFEFFDVDPYSAPFHVKILLV
jgi:hypothetical protein